jgi:prepilin-type N-terminal cleavage/methylation domain-containing protein
MYARMLDQRRRHSGRGESGLTLIEIVVAMAVFAILALASSALIFNGLHISHESSNRVYAASLAATEMDVLRAQDPTKMTLGLTTKTINTPRGQFTIADTAEWLSLGASTGSCDNGNGGSRAYLRLHIEVWGLPLPRTSSVKLDTLLAPQQNSFDPTDGNIAVKISQADGTPAQGVQVTITNVSGDTNTFSPQSTGVDGCAYFPGLNASSVWNVTVSQSGYATPTDTTTISQQATIPQAGTYSLNLAYDQAATLNVQLPGGVVTPANMPISIVSTYISRVQAVAAFPYLLTPLFPVPSGYQIWLGACNDSDPLYPGRSGGTVGSRTAYTTSPGSNGTARLAGVEVDFTDVTAGTLTITHAAETGGSYCSAVQTYTMSVTGSTKVFLPYGTWTLKDASGTSRTIVLDPSDSQINLSMSTGAIT